MNFKAFIKTHSVHLLGISFLFVFSVTMVFISHKKEQTLIDPYHLGYLGPFPSPIHIIGTPEETTSPFVGKIDTLVGFIDTVVACPLTKDLALCSLVGMNNETAMNDDILLPEASYFPRQIVNIELLDTNGSMNADEETDEMLYYDAIANITYRDMNRMDEYGYYKFFTYLKDGVWDIASINAGAVGPLP